MKLLEKEGRLYTISNNIKDTTEIKSYVSTLLNVTWSRKGKLVIITNTVTKEIVLCRSKREIARYLNADPASFYNRDNLFRNIYIIEIWN